MCPDDVVAVMVACLDVVFKDDWGEAVEDLNQNCRVWLEGTEQGKE